MIDNLMDMYTRHVNMMLYGAPPAKEVKPSEEWDYLVLKANDEWDGYYYRRGEGISVGKHSITIRRTEYEWIPNEKAIEQLKSLMDSWRANGWSDLADSVEIDIDHDEDYGETKSSIYESLGKSKSKRISKTFPLSVVKFYKELPYDPSKGLRELINEPRQSAKFTGLHTTSDLGGY